MLEGIKWFDAQLALNLPLRARLVIEQAAVPGDHLERQAPALTLPDIATCELLIMRLYKEGLEVSVHIALTVLVQPLAVLRQRHQCRARLIRMLSNGGAEGVVTAGKRRAHGRQKAFLFSIAKDGMLLTGLAAMFWDSWSRLRLPSGEPLPFLCPRYEGAFGTPTCRFVFDHAMYLHQHNATLTLMLGRSATSYEARHTLPTVVGYARGDLVTAHAVGDWRSPPGGGGRQSFA